MKDFDQHYDSTEFVTVDEKIEILFKNITQKDLIHSPNYSNKICELCLRSLQFANTLKTQLVQNQKRLIEKYSSRKRMRSNETKDLTRSIQVTSAVSSAQTKCSDKDKSHDKTVVQNHFEGSVVIKTEPEILDPLISCNIEFNHDKAVMLKKEENDCRSNNVKKFKNDKNVCPFCETHLNARHILIRHVKSIHMKQKFFCVLPYCEATFKRREKIKPHFMSQHAKNLPPHERSSYLEMIRSARSEYDDESSEYKEFLTTISGTSTND